MTRADLIAKLEAAEGPSRECVIWPRAKDNKGRGRIWVGGRLKLAHRAVWEEANGPIEAGKMLCHTCDNPSCVNLAHLYVGTHADNMRDMKQRRRAHFAKNPEAGRAAGLKLGHSNTWAKNEGNPRAKLTPQQVSQIRDDRRATRFLADEYGVDRTTIQRIRRGALWTI